ncbi:hypothetical protein M3668_05095 [Rothia sp. P100]|uniref:hypothetical protein n=1 Tax=Rothia sp. P100 TaxID=2939578 RepID=UPI00203ED7FB|nr:hypothetical protein [Rothia sp. P100]MCM3510154.1 hypothetical protein [Rothia sp. P100]
MGISLVADDLIGEDDEPERCAGNGQHAENSGEQRGLLATNLGHDGAQDLERADDRAGSILRVEASGPSHDGSRAADSEEYL